MTLLLTALAILVAGGLAAMLCERRPALALLIGSGSAMAGSLLGAVSAAQHLITSEVFSWRRPWQVPYGELYLEIDGLSAFFLLAIFGLSLLAALYGSEYLESYRTHKKLGAFLFFFNLLIAGMAVVCTARNGMLFLFGWEVMSLASYFLVTFEHEKPEVQSAGLTYLIATHLGTAFLFAFFAWCAVKAGSMSFDRFGDLAAQAPATLGIFFILALIGFGTKAGFVPLHVWLPEAHPAAPSHVSALMSGVMIKTGIYGILRMLTFLGPPPVWWGVVLLVIATVSGILGVLFALAQHDLKRLLAYHSVENIGIISLGMGVGLLGQATGQTLISAAGYAGALFHVLNHALFKGLLFLNAGAVLHATSTREMDHLGGLLKRMPVTGTTFLIGAVAISGLPPLNGFVSEWLIYIGMFRGGLALTGAQGLLLFFSAAGLALIGGLALACFTKAFGIVFLGEPRSEHAQHAHEAGWRMRTATIALAAGCILFGLFPLLAMRFILPAENVIVPASATLLAPLMQPLLIISLSAAGIWAGIFGLALLRRWILRQRPVTQAVTWGCGYAQPTARMQYTSSSFAQPITRFVATALRPYVKLPQLSGFFPASAAFASETRDAAKRYFYRPLFVKLEARLLPLRRLQHGRVQVYLLYILLTLIVLLLWKGGA